MRLSFICVLVALPLGLSSCVVVEPWERGILAAKEMTIENDELLDSLDDHIYFSKEATSGGRGLSGGGCGCN